MLFASHNKKTILHSIFTDLEKLIHNNNPTKKNSCGPCRHASTLTTIHRKKLTTLYRKQLLILNRGLKERQDKIILIYDRLENSQLRSPTSPVLLTRYCPFRLELVPNDNTWPV